MILISELNAKIKITATGALAVPVWHHKLKIRKKSEKLTGKLERY